MFVFGKARLLAMTGLRLKEPEFILGEPDDDPCPIPPSIIVRRTNLTVFYI